MTRSRARTPPATRATFWRSARTRASRVSRLCRLRSDSAAAATKTPAPASVRTRDWSVRDPDMSSRRFARFARGVLQPLELERVLVVHALFGDRAREDRRVEREDVGAQ